MPSKNAPTGLADFAETEARQSFDDKAAKSGAEAPGVTRRGDKLTVVGAPGESLDDINALLRRRGIDPNDWIVERVIVNEWETNAVIQEAFVSATNHQLKIWLTPRLHLILPDRAATGGPRFTARAPDPIGHNARLVVALPDQQIPYHDRELHECVLGWLEYNRPDIAIWSGDGIDLPGASTHLIKAHELATSMQDGLDQAYGVLREDVEAAAGAEWHYVPGNHEHRFQKAILRLYPQLYGITRAEGEARILSLPYLLRLDELGVTWVTDPVYEEDYPQGHVALSKYLAVYHGWIARPKSGLSALATLDHLGHSVIVGHSHRQAQVFHTKHQLDGELRVLTAVEAGTLSQPRGGLGYSVAPNWQQGFATAWLYPDGTFKAELATYVNGVLLWNEQRYIGGKLA